MTLEEMRAIVEAAHARGHKVAIHSYGAARSGCRPSITTATTSKARDEFGFKPDAVGPLQDYIARNLEAAGWAVKAGVRLGMGSDAVSTMFGQNTREWGWVREGGNDARSGARLGDGRFQPSSWEWRNSCGASRRHFSRISSPFR